MKKNFPMPVLLVFILFVCSLALAQEKTLADIYKTGKIKFVKEIVLSDKSLTKDDYFKSLTDVSYDRSGSIYICDYDSGNIKKFNAKEEFIKSIGRPGQGPGDFGGPVEVEIVEDRLYVRESRNFRVSILDLEGTFIKSVSLMPIQGGLWWRMKVLPRANLVVEKERIFYEDPSRPQECLIELYSKDLESLKTIYKREVWSNKYITEPRRINVPIPFSAKVYWDVTPDGKIVIGYSEKYEIEVYDPDKGKLFAFTYSYKPVEVTQTDKDMHFRGITVSFTDGTTTTRSQGAPDYIVKNTEFPKYKPAFNDIRIDSEGNIWVHPYHENRQEESRSFDVFDKNGEFINKARIEGEAGYPYLARMQGRSFWVTQVDKEGYHQVIKYKISE